MFCNVPAGHILPEFEGEIVSARLIMEHGSSSLNIETVAKVVRCEEDGVALSFIDSLIWWPIFTIFRKPAGSSGLRPLITSAQERREGFVIQ